MPISGLCKIPILNLFYPNQYIADNLEIMAIFSQQHEATFSAYFSQISSFVRMKTHLWCFNLWHQHNMLANFGRYFNLRLDRHAGIFNNVSRSATLYQMCQNFRLFSLFCINKTALNKGRGQMQECSTWFLESPVRNSLTLVASLQTKVEGSAKNLRHVIYSALCFLTCNSMWSQHTSQSTYWGRSPGSKGLL